MRRVSMTYLLIFCLITIYGQSERSKATFVHTYYNSDGSIFKAEKKEFRFDKVLDINFYRTNFYQPTYYPKKFINKNFKNQTVIVWNDPKKAKDFESNWTYTYFYDSLSRVTVYSYSSCLICGQQAFTIQISYDAKNRPTTFSIRNSFAKSEPENEKYEFVYDIKDNIIHLKHFKSGQLFEEIDKS